MSRCNAKPLKPLLDQYGGFHKLPDDLEGEYCDGQWHFIFRPYQNHYVKPCPARLAEQVDEQLAEEEGNKQMTFENFDQQYQPEAFKVATRFAEKVIENHRQGDRNEAYLLVFAGITGTGKTHLARAIQRELLLAGVHVVYKKAIDLLRMFIEKERGEVEALQDFSTCVNCEVLILDDLGSEREIQAGGWQGIFEADFLELLDRRGKRHLVITTNLDEEDFEQRYGAKSYSRLHEFDKKVFVNMKPYDYRRKA